MENVTDLNETKTFLAHQIAQLSWTDILTGIILYSIVVVTILGNILVLIAVAVNKNLQTTFNYYVVNLAITDLAVAVTAMSFHTTNNVLRYWPFGSFLCGVWIFFDYGMTFVSVFTLILISVDRFWSVTWSVHYHQHHSKRNTIIAIIIIWFFMLALWLPPCIHDRLHNARPGECIWEPSLNKGFVIVVAAIGHHGSCFVMLFCYLKVLKFMCRRRKIVGTTDCRTSIGRGRFSAIGTEYVSSYGQTAMLNTSVFIASDDKIPSLEGSNSTEKKTNVSVKQEVLAVPSTHTGQMKQNTAPSLKSDKVRRQRRDKAIFVTLTYVIVGYAVCWIPFHVVFDISSICPSCVPDGVYNVAFWLTYLNSTINPFLYNFSTPEFRRTFRKLLCRK